MVPSRSSAGSGRRGEGADRWIAAGVPFAGILAGAGLVRLWKSWRQRALGHHGAAAHDAAAGTIPEDTPLAPLTPKGSDSPLNTATSAAIEECDSEYCLGVAKAQEEQGSKAMSQAAPEPVLHGASYASTVRGDASKASKASHGQPTKPDASAILRQAAAALAAEPASSRIEQVSLGEEVGKGGGQETGEVTDAGSSSSIGMGKDRALPALSTDGDKGRNVLGGGGRETSAAAREVEQSVEAAAASVQPVTHDAGPAGMDREGRQLHDQDHQQQQQQPGVEQGVIEESDHEHPEAPTTPTASGNPDTLVHQEVPGSIPAAAAVTHVSTSATALPSDSTLAGVVQGNPSEETRGVPQLLRVRTMPHEPTRSHYGHAETEQPQQLPPARPVAVTPMTTSAFANGGVEPATGTAASLSPAPSSPSQSTGFTQATRHHSRPFFKALLRDVSAPGIGHPTQALGTVYSCPTTGDYVVAGEPAPAPEPGTDENTAGVEGVQGAAAEAGVVGV